MQAAIMLDAGKQHNLLTDTVLKRGRVFRCHGHQQSSRPSSTKRQMGCPSCQADLAQGVGAYVILAGCATAVHSRGCLPDLAATYGSVVPFPVGIGTLQICIALHRRVRLDTIDGTSPCPP